MAKTKDALKIIDSITGNDEELRELISRARVNEEVAQLIYEARLKAGLTQKELAELIGTKQPVIARLEDANYTGHSLFMLQKIASALNHRLEIRLRPAKPQTRISHARLAG